MSYVTNTIKWLKDVKDPCTRNALTELLGNLSNTIRLNLASNFQINGTTVTATAAEINAAADVSGRLVAVGDVAAYTALAANSGKPHIIPDLTADLTITLPTAASGLDFEFIYGGVAADAQDWAVDAGSDTNFFLGGLAHLDTDAGAAGDEIVPVAPDGDSNSILNVLVPDVGTRVRVICDGTNWFVNGSVVGATAPTFADQA